MYIEQDKAKEEIAQTEYEENEGALDTYDEMDRVSKEHSQIEEYACSFVKRNAEDEKLYNKHTDSDTSRASSLEEAINKGINLMHNKNDGKSIYISSTGLTAKSPYDMDDGYKKITNPSQIKLTKEGDNYKITKEYGNLIEDSQEKIKHDIEVINKLSQDNYNQLLYSLPEGESPDEFMGSEIENIIEKDFKISSKEKGKIGSRIYDNPKSIERELLKLNPIKCLPFASINKSKSITKKINTLITNSNSDQKKIADEKKKVEKECDAIYERRDLKTRSLRNKCRIISELGKSQQISIKKDQEFKLDNSLKIVPNNIGLKPQDQKISKKARR